MRVSELSKRTPCLLTTGKADVGGERKTFSIFSVNLPDRIIRNMDTHKMVVAMSIVSVGVVNCLMMFSTGKP